MATVLRAGRFRVAVYGPPREHQPPHVHVVVGRGQVIVRLGAAGVPPTVWAVYGLNDRDAMRAFRLVERHLGECRSAWEALHGKGTDS